MLPDLKDDVVLQVLRDPKVPEVKLERGVSRVHVVPQELAVPLEFKDVKVKKVRKVRKVILVLKVLQDLVDFPESVVLKVLKV